MLQTDPIFLPKDFIETLEGLIFAVVQHGIEKNNGQDRVLCFLRYIAASDQQNCLWQKVGTDNANNYLKQNYPQYLYYSPVLDTNLHGVPVGKIVRHHQPKHLLQQLLQQESFDCVEQDCFDLCQRFQQCGLNLSEFGITGSILINAQQASSDIDLVCYDREQFHHARTVVADLIRTAKLAPLRDKDWQESYERRACSLSLVEYTWHEQRKLNKAIINGRKFDLSYVNELIEAVSAKYIKQGAVTMQFKVINAGLSFDYPAVFKVEHATITEVLCFTATYMGQATEGEIIEVSGFLEGSDNGHQRIIVGSSREAPGEYIKVISCHH